MRVLFTAVGIIAFSGTLFAQTKAPAKPAAKPVAKAVADTAAHPVAKAVAETAAKALEPAPTAVTPGPVEYAYEPAGRRDPFLGLVAAAGSDARAVVRHGDGINTFSVNEISVRGIMQSRSKFVAMIKGPDNKTYLIHQGDKLADGVVKTVTPQGLVVLQDISDPLSAQKQREVRKLLRSLEDAKEKL
ncbi:MAG TPA: pilus assembly protein PilP [Vicinamibacterales bacterium]